MRNICRICSGPLVKAGKLKTGKQRFRCKECHKYQLLDYQRKPFDVDTQKLINIYLEGCGIRSLARIFNISPATVLNKIKKISASIAAPLEFPAGATYEMDEISSFVHEKGTRVWIIYSIERKSRRVVHFRVGGRSKANLGAVVERIMSHNPKKICTDKLNIYPSIIPRKIHRTSRFLTNRIERFNLTIRTHLKRLNRRTICFTRSSELLIATLKLYFWFRCTSRIKVNRI